MARASAATGSPKPGIPSKPTCTSSSPTRLTIATPFHWLVPAAATSYPRDWSPISGSWSSRALVSWRASTSTSWRCRNASTRSMRDRSELTFQVAMRTPNKLTAAPEKSLNALEQPVDVLDRGVRRDSGPDGARVTEAGVP